MLKPDAAGQGSPSATRVRWRIVTLLMGICLISHVNRAAMSVAGTDRIMDQYGIDPTRMGFIYSTFLLVYSLCMIPGGLLIDRYGPRRALMVVGFGSAVFGALTGMMGWFLQTGGTLLLALTWVRGTMGLVSAPLHPAAARSIASWFPFAQRSWANGLVTAAAIAGVALSYPGFGALIEWVDWPGAFLICAALTGAITLAWTWQAKDDPANHPRVNTAERDWIAFHESPSAGALASGFGGEGGHDRREWPGEGEHSAVHGPASRESLQVATSHEPPREGLLRRPCGGEGGPDQREGPDDVEHSAVHGTNSRESLQVAASDEASLRRRRGGEADATMSPSRGWSGLLANRSLVLLTLSYAAVGYFQYLFVYWMQFYLEKVLHVGAIESKYYASMLQVGLALGMPIGGWLSGFLAQTKGVRSGRAIVSGGGMVLSAFMLGLGVLARDPGWIVAFFALAHIAIGASEGPIWATAVDIGGPKGGTAAAICNTGGNLGGLLAPVLTPWISGHFGWPYGIGLGGVICLLGALCWCWIDPKNRIEKQPRNAH